MPPLDDKQPLTHKQLVAIAYRWVMNRTSCGVAFREFNCSIDSGEIPDVIGFSSWTYSVLVECKCSRADFFRDQQKKFRKNGSLGMGRFRFYLSEQNIIRIEDLPPNWGLVYVNDKKQARLVHNPFGPLTRASSTNIYTLRDGIANYNLKAEHQLMYSALRRLHLRNRIDEIYESIIFPGQ